MLRVLVEMGISVHFQHFVIILLQRLTLRATRDCEEEGGNLERWPCLLKPFICLFTALLHG